MDAMFDVLTAFRPTATPRMVVSVLVFLAAATLAFGVMAVVRVQRLGQAARRRIIGRSATRSADDARSLRHSSLQGRAAADRLHHQALFGEQQRARPRCCAAG